HFINTTTFAARDFWPGRGARCFRTGTSTYPSGVCKERATTSGPKRTAARRVASLFGSGFVAPLPAGRQVGHSPTAGDAPSSRLARTEKRRDKLLQRWQEIRADVGSVTTPSGLKLPRLALPESDEPGEIARYLFGEGLPGEFPFMNAAYPEMYVEAEHARPSANRPSPIANR